VLDSSHLPISVVIGGALASLRHLLWTLDQSRHIGWQQRLSPPPSDAEPFGKSCASSRALRPIEMPLFVDDLRPRIIMFQVLFPL
jgi:hypothetical protein